MSNNYVLRRCLKIELGGRRYTSGWLRIVGAEQPDIASREQEDVNGAHELMQQQLQQANDTIATLQQQLKLTQETTGQTGQ